MVLSIYAQQRILFYDSQRLCAPAISKLLAEMDSIFVSRVTIWKFLVRYAKRKSIARLEGSGCPTKIEVKRIVEAKMQQDDETTTYQIHKFFIERGFTISLSTILHCRLQLGWTYRGSVYCQLIKTANKEKQLLWYLDEVEDGFYMLCGLMSLPSKLRPTNGSHIVRRAVHQRQNPGNHTPVSYKHNNY